MSEPLVAATALAQALYKYTTADRLDALDGWLRCSTAAELNDVFEMMPLFGAWSTPDELRDVVQKRWPAHIQRAVNEALERATRVSGVTREQFLAIPAVRQTLDSLQRLDVTDAVAAVLGANLPNLNAVLPDVLRATVGVVCFAESAESVLMWAHYADMHTGLVVEYAPDHPWFNRPRGPEDEFFRLRKVRYQRERPALVATQSEGADIFLTKSEDWSYEREWRVLLPLESCEDRGNDSRGRPLHVVQLPEGTIRRVILGCRMTPEGRQTVIARARGIAIHEAVPLGDRYGLEIRSLP